MAPWTNRGGGASGGNGGGPWGSPGPRGPQPPNLEDLLRQGQDRVRRMLPGGFGGGRGLLAVALIVAAVWGVSGFYRVQPDEQGVVLRFGEWVTTTVPGLHYHLPAPIESVLTPKVTTIHREEIGFRSANATGTALRNVPEEALMLTGDENIVDINFSVFWRIKDAGAYLFNLERQEVTVQAAAEAAMRQIIGNTSIGTALSEGRAAIQLATRTMMQEILDTYQSGIEITEVNMQKSDPPAAVIDSYRDVQRARADAERQINEAQAYENDIVPRARGEAAQMIQGAEAYKAQVVAEADGDAQRFLSVYREYAVAKDVTLRRLYLETMQEVLGGANKIILDQTGGAQGVVPYLPLQELQRRPQGGAN
ncbi:MAG: FtsH protease activity modulator HflK [Proteobacteria bacterium]|nr:FtsH protease activity modulator HflK [Pseudomonadota bacterium]